VDGIGNVTAASEFNMFCDPNSARAVFRSPVTKTLIPLDVTRAARLTLDFLDRLPPETTRALAVWLVGNAAETFDTEAANRFRAVSPASPHRITAAPYWVRKHAEIAPAVFQRARIKSKVNCSGCHRDAVSGRFDDQLITIPEG
jgi:inosine-uridine nucleoside N-ribohydrolase